MPLKTSLVDTLRAAPWSVIVRAVNRWPARSTSCRFLPEALLQPSIDTVVPIFPRQDRFLAFVLLKSTADVYNKVYNSHGSKIRNSNKTRGCHG